jgi:hypothetical protein
MELAYQAEYEAAAKDLIHTGGNIAILDGGTIVRQGSPEHDALKAQERIAAKILRVEQVLFVVFMN